MKTSMYGRYKFRKDVSVDLEQGTRELILHLIKLYLYPTSAAVGKWRKGVARNLHSVNPLKVSHKLPSMQFIFDNTWSIHKKYLSNYVKTILNDYGYTSKIDYRELYNDIQCYFLWISKQLSIRSRVPYNEIYTHLQKLGF